MKRLFFEGWGWGRIFNSVECAASGLDLTQTRKSLQKNKVALRKKHRDELMKKETDKIEYTATIF